jgi:Fe-S-cluster-containing hydrogenase component 2
MNMEIAGFALNPSTALFCKECESACPEEAISDAGKWMVVDRDKCTDCGVCVDMCPTNVIYLDGDEKAVICNLCEGSPKCVEWCPKEVIDNE